MVLICSVEMSFSFTGSKEYFTVVRKDLKNCRDIHNYQQYIRCRLEVW